MFLRFHYTFLSSRFQGGIGREGGSKVLTMDEFDAGTQTVLNEEQARKRAGLTSDGHNHGEDWGDAGVTGFFIPFS